MVGMSSHYIQIIQFIRVNKNSSELIRVRDSQSENITHFGIDTYQAYVMKYNTAYIVFGDGIDNLYAFTSDNDYRVRAINIMREFLSLGKSGYGMGIISGSTHSIKTLIHKTDRNDIRHYSFPNMNYTVYRERIFYPARTEADIRLTLTTKKIDINKICLHKLFVYTGGIGRNIDAYFSGIFLTRYTYTKYSNKL